MSESRTRIKRRHRSHRSQPESMHPVDSPRRLHRSSSYRLIVSVWLLVAVNFCLLIVGIMLLGGQDEDAAAIDRIVSQQHNKTHYQQAIEAAAHAGYDRVSHLLQPIDFTNPLLEWQEYGDEQWVKMLLWTSESEFEQHYRSYLESGETAQTGEGDPRIWLTPVPQVRQFCRRLQNDNRYDASFRIKQYLGLNPSHRYQRFVELWVHPDDLFRPCPDPEIDDRFCNLEVSQRGAWVKNIEDYPAFLRRLANRSYQPEGRPWTGLGYTYDWAYSRPGEGASEYMLVPKGRYRVAESMSTDEYCGLDEAARAPISFAGG